MLFLNVPQGCCFYHVALLLSTVLDHLTTPSFMPKMAEMRISGIGKDKFSCNNIYTYRVGIG